MDILLWFTKLSKPQILLFCYFDILFIYMIILLHIRKRNIKSFKRNNLKLGSITYLIAVASIAVSCLIKEMVKPNMLYQLAMLFTAVIFNILLINGGSIKKIYGVEIDTEIAASYKEVTEYTKYVDEVSVLLTEYIASIYTLRNYEIKTQKELAEIWAIYIENYAEKYMVKIEAKELDMSDNALKNYITHVVSNKDLWYNKDEINGFLHDIRNQNVVTLSNKIRLIPIDNVFNALIYVEAKKVLTDFDVQFIISTYTSMGLMYLLKKGGTK